MHVFKVVISYFFFFCIQVPSSPSKSKTEKKTIQSAQAWCPKCLLSKNSWGEFVANYILSARALGSPLLMLSGNGPGSHLQDHGILVVVDQLMVGRGMTDNPMNVLSIPSPISVEVSHSSQLWTLLVLATKLNIQWYKLYSSYDSEISWRLWVNLHQVYSL